MAGSRLSEARRCFALLALILLLITLFGSHLPWMEIQEPDHIHTWQITETGHGDIDGGQGQVTFYMTEYFNLLSVESCQTFREDSDFYFTGQVLCSVMPFSDADKNTVDVHDWSMYSDSCESAGLTAFVLVLTSVALLVLVVAIATFKNVQRKCCPKIYESQHGKAKCMVPTCAAFAPICGIIAILLYFVQCINNVKGTEVVEVEGTSGVARSATGYQGFWIAMTGTICLVFWWILFTVWFCGKKAGSATFPESADPGTRSDSVRTQSQKQPIIDNSEDEEEENSRMELASHEI